MTFEPGIYLTGSIFVGNNVNLCIPKGATLIGSQDINDYKRIPTRVAGIEMEWPAALVNIIDKKNAENVYSMLKGIVIPGKEMTAIDGEDEENRNSETEELI